MTLTEALSSARRSVKLDPEGSESSPKKLGGQELCKRSIRDPAWTLGKERTWVRKREVKRRRSRKTKGNNMEKREKPARTESGNSRHGSILLSQKMWNGIKVYQKPANIHDTSFFLLQFLDSKLICNVFLSKYGSLKFFFSQKS